LTTNRKSYMAFSKNPFSRTLRLHWASTNFAPLMAAGAYRVAPMTVWATSLFNYYFIITGIIVNTLTLKVTDLWLKSTIEVCVTNGAAVALCIGEVGVIAGHQVLCDASSPVHWVHRVHTSRHRTARGAWRCTSSGPATHHRLSSECTGWHGRPGRGRDVLGVPGNVA